MPVPEMDLHEALFGHASLEPSALFSDGVQMRAHWVGLDEPWVSSTHSGLAVAPSGTSLGHLRKRPVHAGEQNEPWTPVIWTAVSPSWHGPAFGSS